MTDDELKGLFDGLGNQLRAEMRVQGEELRGEMRAQGEELRGEIGAQGKTLRGEMLSGHAELKHHFDVVAERFDTKFDLLAEGILNLDEKMDRNHASIREEMRQGFADTHDLIKFSYNLARRHK